MNDSPLVSVVIPCYNLGQYLREALDSVRAQTLRGIEIVIVDDGSTEAATLAILAELNLEGVTVLRTVNQGLSAARNAGIAAATGRYILPLDADDRIAPRFLEQAAAVLEADPDMGIVYGRVELFGEACGIWEQPGFSLPEMLLGNLIVATALFRRVDWERLGGYRVKMVYGWEDWDYWLAIIASGRKVLRLPEVVFYYRIRNGSMTTRMTYAQKMKMFAYLLLRHWPLYLSNSLDILRRLMPPGRRTVVSPRS
jgi:glycosyltransferase involved in cell wall biosynthesis